MTKFLIKVIILFICFNTALQSIAVANEQNKKCTGATPCLACKTIKECKKCKYCKTGKKCGTCKTDVQPPSDVKARHTICDGLIIYGPIDKALLPLPATMERTVSSLANVGLILRDNSAVDTSNGKVQERYRFIFTDKHLTSIISDTVFTTIEAAAHYVDTTTKELRKSIQSKEDMMVTLGLGGYKTYYLPPIICGFRAIGHIFTFAPNMLDNTATLTHEVKMVALPEK